MRFSLKQQLLLLVIGPLLLLALSMTTIISIHANHRTQTALIEKAKSDLAAAEAIIDLKYPGAWEVKEGNLYKGEMKISGNYEVVDFLADLTGDTVTIFLNDTRVATTVRKQDGNRATGTKVSDVVATTVLKNGQTYLGEANVVGEKYQTAYQPIFDRNGNIIGILYVGISKALLDGMIKNSLITIGIISTALTLLVGFAAWFGTQRMIVGPLQQITSGTRKIASGNLASGALSSKVEVKGDNEIADLAVAFNQMVEGLQSLAQQINKTTGNNSSPNNTGNPINPINLMKPVTSSDALTDANNVNTQVDEIKHLIEEELPKGINEQTLRQILSFLDEQETPMSSEEVGEGVNLTRVTVRRYLEYLEQCGLVEIELKYGTVGRPVKLYKKIPLES